MKRKWIEFSKARIFEMIDTENCIGECSPCAKRVLCRAQFIISDKIVFLVSIVVLFTIDVS